MSVQRTPKKKKAPGSLQRDVIRRALLILLPLAVLVAAGGIVLFQSAVRARAERLHETTLIEQRSAFENVLGLLAEESDSLANRATLLGAMLDPSPQNQQAALRLLLEEALERPDVYLRLRLINRDGSTIAGVERAGPVYNRDVGPNAAADSLPYVNRMIELGETILSPVQRVTLGDGSERVSVTALSPVLQPESGSVIGALEVVGSIEALLTDMSLPPGLSWLLLDRDNQYVWVNEVTMTQAPSGKAVPTNLEEPLRRLVQNTGGEMLVQPVSGLIASSERIQVEGGLDMPWSLVLLDESGVVTAQVFVGSGLILAALLGFAGMASWAIYSVLRLRLQPLVETRAAALKLAATGDPVDTLIMPRGEDEFSDLTDAFNRLSVRVHTMTEQLDEQTRNQAEVLATANRLSRQINAKAQSEAPLAAILDGLCEEFRPIYHAQLFVLDDIGANAVLMFGRGQVGEQLVAQRYRVPAGANNPVGQAAVGQKVVVQDMGAVRGRYEMADVLPDTRARVTLPLMAGDEVTGVLDIHSARAYVFDDALVQVFQLLADQMALTLERHQKLVMYRAALRRQEGQEREDVREAWRSAQERLGLAQAYQYDLQSVGPVEETQEDDIAALSVPIVIRGEVIGTMTAASPEEAAFTQGDHALLRAVADRVGLALEGARLFAETQTNLAVTTALYELARRLNTANQLQDIVAGVVQTVAPEASEGQIWLFEEVAAGSAPERLELAASWPQDMEEGDALMRPTLALVGSPLLTAIQGTQVQMIQDVERDQRLDAPLRGILKRQQARSAAFIPFSVRGAWRGVLMLLFEESRRFSDSEGRIFMALVDQAGVAIDNRMLIEQTAMTLDQIERLYAASRIINAAQTPGELVRAVLAATRGTSINFELGLLEGALDSSGWPSQVRITAYSAAGEVYQTDRLETLALAPNAPLRQRQPQSMRLPSGFVTIFPLFSAKQPIALLYLLNQSIGELWEEDYETYNALAGQMSTVLENQRLLERTSLALDETRRLYDASLSITTAPDLQAAYEAIGLHLRVTASGLSQMSVLRMAPEPMIDAPYLDCDFVWTLEATGTTVLQAGARLTAQEAPFAALFDHASEALIIPDIDRDLGEGSPLHSLLTGWGAASAMVAPLQTAQRWLGVLVLQSWRMESFTPEMLPFVRAVAGQIAIAMENQQLFEEARAEAEQALVLAEVGQLAAQVGSSFKTNASALFQRVAEAAGYNRWQFALLSSAADRLEFVTLRTVSMNDTFQGFYYSLDSTVHPLVDTVMTGKELLVNNPSAYPGLLEQSYELVEDVGKFVSLPVRAEGRVVGAFMLGRGLDEADLAERDQQLARTLAAQITVALENQRLFERAESERAYLRSILETMPTGVIVVDPRTGLPIQVNDRAAELLGQAVRLDEPLLVENYHLRRTGTELLYPQHNLPLDVTMRTGQAAFADDLAVRYADGTELDLLMSAAPVTDGRGAMIAIVTAVQDISNLRGLEATLQNNLREQIGLYEAARSLSEARDLDEVLDVATSQLAMVEADDGYLLLLDEEHGGVRLARSLSGVEECPLPMEVFQEGPLFIDNLMLSPMLEDAAREQLRAMGIAALAVVPLRTRDIIFGWLAALYQRLPAEDIDNSRFLATLADASAVAIDNRTLMKGTEQAYQAATRLYDLTRSLANVTSAQEVLDVAIHKLGLRNLTQAFLAVPSGEGRFADLAVVAEGEWLSPLYDKMIPPQHPLRVMLDRSEVLLVSDVHSSLHDPALKIALEQMPGVRSAVMLPLRSAGRRLGSIWLASSLPQSFNEGAVQLFQSFVEQASLSMEAARLLAQTERRARQLATSAQVSQFASAILDLNDLLPRLVELIRDSFKYDHVQIFLMDARDEYAELRASTGEAGRQLLAIQHKLAKGSASVIGQVTATGQPTIALDTADAHVVHKPNKYLPRTRSEMALPLIAKGKIVGALDVQSNQPYAFTDEDVAVLGTLANQISVALENARLFVQAESRARDMSFLFNVTTMAAAADKTLHEALADVSLLVCGALNAQTVAVYLTETYQDSDGEPFTLLKAVALAGSDQPLSEVEEIILERQDRFLSRAARGLEAWLLATVEAEPDYLPISPMARSAVVAPMAIGSQLIGAMVLEASQPNHFSDDILGLMTTLTSSLSTVVENSRLLEQVQLSNEQLRELDKMKSDFLANMSHELRTPLNSIIGFSRVILKGIDGPLTEMQEQDLTTIYNSGTHLLGLINDILDQAKINSGKMDLHLDHFDMKPLAEGVRSIGIGLIKDKPVDLRLEVASGLPRAYGDEFRTRQVLLNLVSNAAKFTKEGAITIRVYAEYVADGGQPMVRVDVTDTGIGIAEADMPLLFEAFRQVDSSLTRTVGGTGLGLPIAKSLIEMQGGQMLVQSQVNVGSTFSIVLPTGPQPVVPAEAPPSDVRTTGTAKTVQPDPDKRATHTLPSAGAPRDSRATGTMPAAPSSPATTKPATGPLTPPPRPAAPPPPLAALPISRQVLLIEDNPDMVDQLRRALQRESMDIFAASIPLEAEAMASGLRPSLIIMNADFAKGVSWDILGRLQGRADTREIPVILLALDDVRQRAEQAGAFAFLQRPFMPDQLVRVVRQAQQAASQERIVVIDDQPESQRLLETALRQAGNYRVYAAHSGTEGMELIAQHRPQLIVLDLRMPEQDGFAVLAELQANPETAQIPVMIVTAEALEGAERERLAAREVLYKTDLSQENYGAFIAQVRQHLLR